MAYFLQKKYLQKPRQWGPQSIVKSSVLGWFDKHGIAPPVVFIPCWENTGIAHDYGKYGYDTIFPILNPGQYLGSGALQNSSSYGAVAIGDSVNAPENIRFGYTDDFTAFTVIDPSAASNGQYVLAWSTSIYLQKRTTNGTPYFYYGPRSQYNYTLTTFPARACSFAGTHRASDGMLSMYLDGDLLQARTGSGTGAAQDFELCVGGYQYDYTPNAFNGQIYLTIVIRGCLSGAQIAQLHDDPYGMLQPRAMPIYSFSSADAGSTYQLTAAGGSYAVSGSDAGLLRSARLEASGGSLSISGTAASLLFSRLIDASSGSFLLTGADAELRSNRYMLADNGAFALTGSDVTLTYTPVGAYILTADGGSFVLTGSDVALLRDLVLTADGGSFSINGAAAGLVFDRVMSAVGGSYALTGSEAALTYTQAGAYILTCDAGSFALSGSGVDLLRYYIMPVEPGNYALSGADAGLLLSRMLAASGGTFTFTGADAEFLRDYNLICDGGTYTLTGSDVTLTYSGYELPSGKMSITFSIKQPGVLFSQKTPGITFTVN